jgi:hypothetical protein
MGYLFGSQPRPIYGPASAVDAGEKAGGLNAEYFAPITERHH